MAIETRSLQNQLKLLNSKLTWNQKISLLILAVLVVAGMASLTYYMNQEDYQTLYSGLSNEESGTVIEKLKELKVVYRLEDSGKVIKVPTARVDELRIQLASEGLPQSGKIGFEIFDRTSFGMTEFVEQVNYRRALEGELVRTILSLKEIGQARVHLVLPKQSLFEERAQPAKASVVVKLNAGNRLSEGSVSGIVHLVASAVEGLDPANVTVTDSAGSLLSSVQTSPEEKLTSTQVELKSRTEKDLSAKVQSILEPVVGAGKVRADTSVVMDFSRVEQTEEKYDPQPMAIRSQQKSQEQSQPGTGAAMTAAGVPGTPSNSANPTPTFVPIGKNGGTSSRESESTNYELSRLTRHTIAPTGEIKKVSVAVIVDNATRADKSDNGTVTKQSISRTPEELKKLHDLASAAIGIDTSRGDVLTVENISFDVADESTDGLPPKTFYEKWHDLIQPGLRYGALLLLFLMAYLLLFRPVSRRLTASIDSSLAPQRSMELPAASVGGPELALQTPKTVAGLEAELADGQSTALIPAVRKVDVLRQRISDFIQKDPENSAQVLRMWLSEKGKQ
jgi:flagellar M-ring protein FliF